MSDNPPVGDEPCDAGGTTSQDETASVLDVADFTLENPSWTFAPSRAAVQSGIMTAGWSASNPSQRTPDV